MKRTLIILLCIPALCFGQLSLKNIETGVSLYSFQGTPHVSPPQLYTHQFFSGGFIRIAKGDYMWRINFDKISYDEAYTLSEEINIRDYDATVNASHHKTSFTIGIEKKFLRSSFRPLFFADAGIYRSHYEGEKWTYSGWGPDDYELFNLIGYGATLSIGTGFYWEFASNVRLRMETTARLDNNFQRVSNDLVSLETLRLTFNPIQRLGISYCFR